MASTQELFEFVKRHYKLVLKENSLWPIIADKLILSDIDPPTIVHSFIHSYPKLVQHIPELASLTDPLFMHVMRDVLSKMFDDPVRSLGIIHLFNTWTQCGTRDIPHDYAATLAQDLHTFRSGGDIHEHFTAFIISQSPNLWTFFENDFLNIPRNSTKDSSALLSVRITICRHAPHREDLHACSDNDTLIMYRNMCGYDLDTKPTLQSLQHSLKGSHNNALAWHTALAVCAPEDPTIVGSWMKMSETFSALCLDPSDQNAWQFWHLLRECVKDDMSGRNLLSCLAETKHEMASAFANGWSIVDALYEDDERYIQASLLYQQKPVPMLALPDVCTRSCFDA